MGEIGEEAKNQKMSAGKWPVLLPSPLSGMSGGGSMSGWTVVSKLGEEPPIVQTSPDPKW
jgi:hypothetical protein